MIFKVSGKALGILFKILEIEKISLLLWFVLEFCIRATKETIRN